MKRIAYPAVVLAAGLVLSQGLFFIVVYRANLLLYAKLSAMDAAGYLTVPNAHVAAQLTHILPAFYGALFFTFTTGAGLCILAMTAAWIYKRIFNSRRWFVLLLLVCWIALLAAVNTGGFAFAASLSVAVIPPFTFILFLIHMPAEMRPQGRLVLALQIAAVLMVALVWLPKTDRDVFIDIRDNILLTNTAGKAVNDFYYRYTLYAANVFKTPGQKQMAAACTGEIADQNLRLRIETLLTESDYLPVHREAPCDLHVTADNGSLFLSASHHKPLLEARVQDFVASPKRILADFSRKADSHASLRRITVYGLFIALPLSLFLLLHGFLCVLLTPVPQIFLRHAAASVLCAAMGIAFALPLYFSSEGAIASFSEIQAALSSDSQHDQRNALKSIVAESMDPLDFVIDSAIVNSTHVPVRYWYAAALGNSKKEAAAEILRRMLDDSHVNVVCMAFSGLGRAGGRQAAHDIQQRIATSDHWYVQWYAYRALRQLGWIQTPSNMNHGLLQ